MTPKITLISIIKYLRILQVYSQKVSKVSPYVIIFAKNKHKTKNLLEKCDPFGHVLKKTASKYLLFMIYIFRF